MSRRGLGDVRALVPRTPPEGLIDWALERDEELGTCGLLYEMEFVDKGVLLPYPRSFDADKRVRMVRVQCASCGEYGYFDYAKNPAGGFGFVHPDLSDIRGWDMPVSDGETTACPFCGEKVAVIRASKLGRRGYAVTGQAFVLSASVVGEEHLLCLTGWNIENRCYRSGFCCLKVVPAEAYVFGKADCAQLLGWRKGYSGNAGYFISYSDCWRQPREWRERWGDASAIYGLTPELVAASTLPHCKLDAYMENFCLTHKKYPVAYLRLLQQHPNAENLLLAAPMLLMELISEQMGDSLTNDPLRGELFLADIDWTVQRPSRMLGLNREELAMAKRQGWGAALWRLYVKVKETGETLTEADMVGAFRLGVDGLDRLVGIAPVGRSIRYLLDQIERTCYLMADREEDDDDFINPDTLIDAEFLLDYWNMAQRQGRRLEDPRLRWPEDLIAAHNEMSTGMRYVEEAELAVQFRLRRRVLWRYCWRHNGLLIRPAKSQRELNEEGDALRHCVSSYGPRHAAGKTAIFFIRRVSEPRKPYFTLELDEAALTVRQNRGFCNCSRTPEVQAFEEAWLAWLHAGCPKERSRNSGRRRGGVAAAPSVSSESGQGRQIMPARSNCSQERRWPQRSQ